ncbi:snake venom 5'-nucleotidase-like [Onthophagus taurus]|uniref:snake venom 5'-nucleotidase-like n=1 Tax=Onthophagus taurus TaxID=166361 RepID=UPI0039BDE2EC
MNAIKLIILFNIFRINLSKTILLTILHSNDIHGNFAGDDDGFGGIPKTLHLVTQIKSTSTEDNPIIYLNAGDIFTGTIWYSIHRTNIAADFVKLMRADAFALGNHEFDEGLDGLENFCDKINQSLLCANGDFSQEVNIKRCIQPSVIITPNNSKLKIGVIGYINSKTGSLTKVGKIKFSDEIEAVRKEVDVLKSKGVKIIIALGHSGIETDKKIARVIDGVDVVVGGHSHTFLYTGDPPTNDVAYGDYPVVIQNLNGAQIPVVQVGYGGKYLGILNLTLDLEGNVLEFIGKPVLLDDKIPDDKEAVELLNIYRPGVESLLNEAIGKSRVYLQGGLFCRRLECNLGNLLTDAMILYKADLNNGPFWTDTPIAVINGGSIRNSINASKFGGIVTKADLLAALPFSNQLITITLNSTSLTKMLEISVSSNGETSFGEFLQVSGLKVIYNLLKPSFNRVDKVLIRCANCDVPRYEAIRNDGIYRVLTSKYLAMGGDGYDVLKDTADLIEENETINEVLIKYLESNAINTSLEDRVRTKRRTHSKRILGVKDDETKQTLQNLSSRLIDEEANLAATETAEHALAATSNKKPEKKSNITNLKNEVLGISRVFLQGGYYCRLNECNFGNLMTDAFCEYKADKFVGSNLYWTDSPIALVNAGTFSASINCTKQEGNITIADLYAALPFGDKLVTLQLNTSTLLQMLENSVKSNGETTYGEFLQVSGLKIVYDMNKKPNQRVVKVMVRCSKCDVPYFEPIKNNSSYTVITNSFLSKGGDGYDFLQFNDFERTHEEVTDLDVVRKYVSLSGIVQANLENRITIIAKRNNGGNLENNIFYNLMLIIIMLQNRA